jgi:hypothetical protein
MEMRRERQVHQRAYEVRISVRVHSHALRMALILPECKTSTLLKVAFQVEAVRHYRQNATDFEETATREY